ncbi:MAG: hypothetical protein ACOYMI_08285 [Phycisphaerales bacterium]
MMGTREIRPIPFLADDRYEISSDGFLFRKSLSNRRWRRRPIAPMSHADAQAQWDKRGNGKWQLVEATDSAEWAHAAFVPDASDSAPLRGIRVSRQRIVTGKLPELFHSRPFMAHGALAHGWYCLRGIGQVPTEHSGDVVVLDRDGTWFFHGPSVGFSIFHRESTG